ncbi:MAG: exodeoxyribonuclease VII small subunit [Prevotella sp.]|nr:exodeoxyribonuclease VII small subunit [Prevotella sp.]MDD6393160.1 exodeoxyribonuclease VII small subunit [Prevotella sp.]MDY2703457.1 exodeoxyribonuclease VII small subunit [Prevotella sp.]
MDNNITYEKAMKEIEDIADKMERREYTIDELTEKLARAQQLIIFCREKLVKTDEEINKLLQNVADNR